MSRGLADLNALEQATPDAAECYELGRRSFNEQLLVCREGRDYSEAPLSSARTPQNRGIEGSPLSLDRDRWPTIASEAMAVHNTRERILFRDLNDKAVLSREVRRLAGSMRRWEARLAKGRGKRWTAQYTNSIRRASARVEDLEQQILAYAEYVRPRVEKELEISVQEVQQFEEHHKKEVQEAHASQQALQSAEQALSTAATARQKAEELTELRRVLRRAERQARKESQDVADVEEELASEARDTEVLTRELHRLLTEIEVLAPEGAEGEDSEGGEARES